MRERGRERVLLGVFGWIERERRALSWVFRWTKRETGK